MGSKVREIKAAIVLRFGTQKAFSRVLGRWDTVVSNVLHGRRPLSAAERERWAALLEVSPDLLAGLRR
jgi:transcriptional regulator with XRE-family HTH domain